MHIDWDRYHIQLQAMGRARWPRGITPEGLLPFIMYPTHDLWVPLEGRARIRLRTGWHTMQPGDCIWLRAGCRYVVEALPNEPFRINFIHFNLLDARGRKYPTGHPLPPEFIAPPDRPAVEILVRRIVDLCFGFETHGMAEPPHPEPAATPARALLTALLMELDIAGSEPTRTRLSHAQESRIRSAAIHISENPAIPHSVEHLARQAGYTRNHFTVLFQRLTGRTPARYAILARIHRACQLLSNTSLSIGEIAEQLGYVDIYGFSHQFKNIMGINPLGWRRRNSSHPRQSGAFTPPQ